MKKLNFIKTIIFIFIIFFFFQSCSWFMGIKPYCKQYGYILDTNEVGISNVKLTVLETEDWEKWTKTDMIYFSDNSGYYEFQFDYQKDKDYKILPTHKDYIYVTKVPNAYPNLVKGSEESENIIMVKKGKVKIEGEVMCDEEDFYWLPGVKISLLKRSNENTNYPDSTGIYTYTDENGHYYIEFDGNNEYEFFLKPQKEGYFYDWGGSDYREVINLDQGYVDKESFVMNKIQ